MNRISRNSMADLFFQIDWSSGEAAHTECQAGRKVNFWRDILPERLQAELMGKTAGEQVILTFEPGELVTRSRGSQALYRRQFNPERLALPDFQPRLGRFYPQGLLSDVAGVFRENREPFRCVGLQNGRLEANFDHPLAGRSLRMTVTVGTIASKADERGGSVRDWAGIATNGAGMQARWQGRPTDFFSDRPYARQNESADTAFYARPRLVHHIDATAREVLHSIYARLLGNGMQVLDLMASWRSHLPAGIRLKQVDGLGLNEKELKANPVLFTRIVHDLNSEPRLPLPDKHYDAVLCTASVEYLIEPIRIFQEVGRILRPGGVFVVAFSNRWFAPKAIRIWSELHDFERMGLVAEYFHRAGGYTRLHTYSLMGLNRPPSDKYYPGNPVADPIYAVWASRA